MDKAKYNEYMRNYMKTRRLELGSSGYFKNSRMKHKYGVSLDRYNDMLRLQENLCLLCKLPLNLEDKLGYDSPVLDHDHSCCSGYKSCGNCLRGIIHRRCNIGLGAFLDDPEQLKLAVEFLEKFRLNKPLLPTLTEAGIPFVTEQL